MLAPRVSSIPRAIDWRLEDEARLPRFFPSQITPGERHFALSRNVYTGAEALGSSLRFRRHPLDRSQRGDMDHTCRTVAQPVAQFRQESFQNVRKFLRGRKMNFLNRSPVAWVLAPTVLV